MRGQHRMPVAIWAVATTVWVAAIAGLSAQQALTPTAFTPVPRVLWFSGVFRPADALPVAPVETVTVAIYPDREGGDALWQETQYAAMDADGRFSLLLGSTVAEGMPLALFTSGEPRWIGITVHRPGEAEQPRVHLASVPYALKAADADTLGGRPASAYLLADPALSSATSAASARAPKDSTMPAASAGTAGYLGMFVDSATLGNSALVQSGGFVGLGTAAPRDGFHVAIDNGGGTLTGYAVQNLSGAAGAYSGMLFYDQNGALGQFQGFNNATHEYRINNIAPGGKIDFMIGSSSKFLVANNGNIGLGVAGPASTLDVVGDINLTGTLKMQGNAVLRQDSSLNNIGLGVSALASNTTGPHNTASGFNALIQNAGGGYNTGIGSLALWNNTSGMDNTAVGYSALFYNSTGSNNIAVGSYAGYGVANGNSNNILIGSEGLPADSGTIRIGAGTQTRFFAAGVRNITTGQNDAVAVMIDSNGQLGTVSSSRRFKEDIQDMGAASRGLMRLRPVTFRYKQPFDDGSKPIQYGLIAEEVAEVYPDLVARSADGQIETVKYQVLDAMLLNEVQRQQADIQALQAEIRTVVQQYRAVVEQNKDLQERLASLEAAITGRR